MIPPLSSTFGDEDFTARAHRPGADAHVSRCFRHREFTSGLDTEI